MTYEIKFKDYTPQKKYSNFEEQILNLIRSADRPISSFTISFITHIPISRVCKKLKTMEKFGLVKKMTTIKSHRISYWTTIEEKDKCQLI